MKKISLEEFEKTENNKFNKISKIGEIDSRLDNEEFRKNILKYAKQITQEDFNRIENKNKEKGVRRMLWMKKIVKQPRRSLHQLRSVSGGFSSINWEGIFLGRGLKKKFKNV